MFETNGRWRLEALVGALLVIAGSLSATAQPPRAAPAADVRETPDLAALAWLAGSWRGVDGETIQEEVWTTPAGGVMLGVHRDVRAGRPAFFEFLRIVADGERIVYLASPMGREPTAFELTELGERSVWFANPAHDYPQRVGYRLEDDGTLVARIEGEVEGRSRASEWRWRRVNAP